MQKKLVEKMLNVVVMQAEVEVDTNGNVWFNGKVVGYDESEDTRLFAPERVEEEVLRNFDKEYADALYSEYEYYLARSEEGGEDADGYFNQACQAYDEYEEFINEDVEYPNIRMDEEDDGTEDVAYYKDSTHTEFELNVSTNTVTVYVGGVGGVEYGFNNRADAMKFMNDYEPNTFYCTDVDGNLYHFVGTDEQIQDLRDMGMCWGTKDKPCSQLLKVDAQLGFFCILPFGCTDDEEPLPPSEWDSSDIDEYKMTISGDYQSGCKFAYFNEHKGQFWFKTVDGMHLYNEEDVEIVPYDGENGNYFNGTCDRYVIKGANARYALYINNNKNYAILHVNEDTDNELVIQADTIAYTIGWIEVLEQMSEDDFIPYYTSLRTFKNTLNELFDSYMDKCWDAKNDHYHAIYTDEEFISKVDELTSEYEQKIIEICLQIAGTDLCEVEDLAILDVYNNEREIWNKYHDSLVASMSETFDK